MTSDVCKLIRALETHMLHKKLVVFFGFILVSHMVLSACILWSAMPFSENHTHVCAYTEKHWGFQSLPSWDNRILVLAHIAILPRSIQKPTLKTAIRANTGSSFWIARRWLGKMSLSIPAGEPKTSPIASSFPSPKQEEPHPNSMSYWFSSHQVIQRTSISNPLNL